MKQIRLKDDVVIVDSCYNCRYVCGLPIIQMMNCGNEEFPDDCPLEDAE